MELTETLEEWIINRIVAPFYKNISKLVVEIRNDFKEPKDAEIYRQNLILAQNRLFDEISKNLIDIQQREELNEILELFVESIMY